MKNNKLTKKQKDKIFRMSPETYLKKYPDKDIITNSLLYATYQFNRNPITIIHPSLKVREYDKNSILINECDIVYHQDITKSVAIAKPNPAKFEPKKGLLERWGQVLDQDVNTK